MHRYNSWLGGDDSMKLAEKIWLKIQRNSMFIWVSFQIAPLPILLIFFLWDLEWCSAGFLWSMTELGWESNWAFFWMQYRITVISVSQTCCCEAPPSDWGVGIWHVPLWGPNMKHSEAACSEHRVLWFIWNLYEFYTLLYNMCSNIANLKNLYIKIHPLGQESVLIIPMAVLHTIVLWEAQGKIWPSLGRAESVLRLTHL